MKIPFLEFQVGVAAALGGQDQECKFQDIAPAPYVHVFDEAWLRDEFWPVWGEIRREIDGKIPVRPMTNNARRRICEAINKRLVAELMLSVQQAYDDEDVSLGALEASVQIPPGYRLNLVADGWHRTLIVAVTKDQKTWRPVFVESQLYFKDYETTDVDIAVAAGVRAVECWM